jgi:hypothetical protein
MGIQDSCDEFREMVLRCIGDRLGSVGILMTYGGGRWISSDGASKCPGRCVAFSLSNGYVVADIPESAIVEVVSMGCCEYVSDKEKTFYPDGHGILSRVCDKISSDLSDRIIGLSMPLWRYDSPSAVDVVVSHFAVHCSPCSLDNRTRINAIATIRIFSPSHGVSQQRLADMMAERIMCACEQLSSEALEIIEDRKEAW